MSEHAAEEATDKAHEYAGNGGLCRCGRWGFNKIHDADVTPPGSGVGR